MPWVDVFRRYVESKLELMATAEKCSLKGWPDRSDALRNTFRLQRLYCEQELRRAEYLAVTLKTTDSESVPTTLKALDAMVNKDWTDLEEKALRQTETRYDALVGEIEQCRAALDSEATNGPLKAVQWDPEYRKARKAAQETSLECDRLLNSGAKRPGM